MRSACGDGLLPRAREEADVEGSFTIQPRDRQRNRCSRRRPRAESCAARAPPARRAARATSSDRLCCYSNLPARLRRAVRPTRTCSAKQSQPCRRVLRLGRCTSRICHRSPRRSTGGCHRRSACLPLIESVIVSFVPSLSDGTATLTRSPGCSRSGATSSGLPARLI